MMTKKVLKFYATWCNPCSEFAPTVKAVFDGRDDIIVEEIDIDANPIAAYEWEILTVPSLVFLLDDIPIVTLRGVLTEKSLREEVKTVFGESG